jgi:hypothetical protein
MDGTDTGTESGTPTVGRRPTHKLVGVIGRPDITDYEKACLYHIGQCIAKLGHTLIIVPAEGVAAAIRGGVESEGGSVQTVEAGIFQLADRILIYPNPQLLVRIKRAQPDYESNKKVVIITQEQLEGWVDAMHTLLRDYDIPRP